MQTVKRARVASMYGRAVRRADRRRERVTMNAINDRGGMLWHMHVLGSIR